MTFYLDYREYRWQRRKKFQDLRKALKDKCLTTDNIIRKIAVTIGSLLTTIDCWKG